MSTNVIPFPVRPAPAPEPAPLPATARRAHTVGNLYEATRDLDVAEIAKRVRRDIKAAKIVGDLPTDAKTSVRIRRYSMGQSIDVYVTLPRPARVPSTDRRSSRHGEIEFGRPVEYTVTVEAANISATVRGILEAYNYDDSDTMTDYFDRRFYADVVIRGAGE